MKKLRRVVRAALPHVLLIVSALLLVLFFIDRVNPAMAFLNNEMTKWLLAFFCGLSMTFAVTVIAEDERRRKEEPKGDGK